MKPTKLFLLVVGLVVVLDQITKVLAQQFLPTVTNTGAAFGILQGQQLLLIGITILVIGVVWWYRKDYPFALGLLGGGAIGNLIDRLTQGFVVDFINIGWKFPLFNIADAANTIGVVLLVLYWATEN